MRNVFGDKRMSLCFGVLAVCLGDFNSVYVVNDDAIVIYRLAGCTVLWFLEDREREERNFKF